MSFPILNLIQMIRWQKKSKIKRLLPPTDHQSTIITTTPKSQPNYEVGGTEKLSVAFSHA